MYFICEIEQIKSIALHTDIKHLFFLKLAKGD